LTNEAGAYQFASLQTGTYKVVAELSGFRTQTYNNVTLGISQQVRLNFTLQVGSVAQAVEVTVAADTAIATSSSSIGTVLSEYKIRDLPLGTRNVMDLLMTNAGVSNAISGSGSNDGASPGDTGYLAGGRLSAVNVTRDGFTVTDQRYNRGAFSVTYVSPDLVEEVRVITAPVDSEVNRGSGQIQMVTRSGGNQYRGSAFWTNRNSAGYANTWFNNFAGAGKDYENRNQFGVRFGGPIIKNKTFFFILVDEATDRWYRRSHRTSSTNFVSVTRIRGSTAMPLGGRERISSVKKRRNPLREARRLSIFCLNTTAFRSCRSRRCFRKTL